MNPLREKWFWGCITLITVIFCQIQFGLITKIPTLIDYIESLGNVGKWLFVLVYVLACIFLIPGSPLTLGAGATFGFWNGLLLVSVGSTLGATAAFLISRYLARGFIEKKLIKATNSQQWTWPLVEKAGKLFFWQGSARLSHFFY